jgi:ornithine cyclodeaminase/alanine dehydrogenase-like protein (mu-crystallin family)
MARKDSGVIAIIGCGTQGRSHLKMMKELFKIAEVRAYDIFRDIAEDYAREMSTGLGLDVKVMGSAKEAVKGADIICVVTTAMEPVIMEEWVEPGCHVCGTTGFRDLDPSCAVKFDKWVVGWYGRDLEWIEGSEVGKLGGLKAGQLSRRAIYADLASEIIPEKKFARESDNERTVMTHLGMPALDASVAALVYEKAKEKAVGLVLKVF